MDDADRAQVEIEALAAYQQTLRKPVAVREPRETCLNCDCPLAEERQACGYCDGECRDEHAFFVARQEANR